MTDDTTTDGVEGGAQETFTKNEVSDLVKRAAVAAAMGQSFGHLEGRDYFDVLGYPAPEELDVDNYRSLYERGGISTAVIEAPAGATWSDVPEITDDGGGEDDEELTDFETDIQTLFDETKLLNYLDRVDTLQRIGRFGVLLIGFDDGNDLEDPLDESKLKGNPAEDILYYQPFGEDNVQDLDRVKETTDERFGMPSQYELDFGDDHPAGVKTVHHSRVLHIAEGALEDEIVGHSAIRPVYNHLVDLVYKVLGGSAEMFWRDAKKRYLAKTAEGAGPPNDEEKVATQIEEFANDLRDIAWLDNAELEELDGGSPNPEGIKDALLEQIAGVTRIPKRRLLGTERGDLASTQDEAAFVSMIQERSRKFAEPQILRPLVDYLTDIGVVADPAGGTYDVEWPDNFELTEVEKAEVMQRKAKAFKDASSMGDTAEIATTEERREEVLELPPERGSAVDPTPSPGGPEDDTDVDVGDELDEGDPEVEDFFDEIFNGEEPGAAVPDGGSREGDT